MSIDQLEHFIENLPLNKEIVSIINNVNKKFYQKGLDTKQAKSVVGELPYPDNPTLYFKSFDNIQKHIEYLGNKHDTAYTFEMYEYSSNTPRCTLSEFMEKKSKDLFIIVYPYQLNGSQNEKDVYPWIPWMNFEGKFVYKKGDSEISHIELYNMDIHPKYHFPKLPLNPSNFKVENGFYIRKENKEIKEGIIAMNMIKDMIESLFKTLTEHHVVIDDYYYTSTYLTLFSTSDVLWQNISNKIWTPDQKPFFKNKYYKNFLLYNWNCAIDHDEQSSYFKSVAWLDIKDLKKTDLDNLKDQYPRNKYPKYVYKDDFGLINWGGLKMSLDGLRLCVYEHVIKEIYLLINLTKIDRSHYEKNTIYIEHFALTKYKYSKGHPISKDAMLILVEITLKKIMDTIKKFGYNIYVSTDIYGYFYVLWDSLSNEGYVNLTPELHGIIMTLKKNIIHKKMKEYMESKFDDKKIKKMPGSELIKLFDISSTDTSELNKSVRSIIKQ